MSFDSLLEKECNRDNLYEKYSIVKLGRINFYDDYREYIDKYRWVIEAFNGALITRKVDRELSNFLMEVSIVMMKLFGEDIDWKSVISELKTSPIRLRDEKTDNYLKMNPYSSGYFVAYPWRNPDIGTEHYARMVVRKDKDIFQILFRFIHEYSHFLHSVAAQNTPEKLQQGDARLGVSQVFLVDGKTEWLGGAFYEGVNNLIGEMVLQELLDNPKLSITYKPDGVYDISDKLSKKINKVTNGKLVKAAFNSKPEIIINEFEEVLGEDAWSQFVKPIDIIYDNDSGLLTRPLEDQERRTYLLKSEELGQSFCRSKISLITLGLSKSL